MDWIFKAVGIIIGGLLALPWVVLAFSKYIDWFSRVVNTQDDDEDDESMY